LHAPFGRTYQQLALHRISSSTKGVNLVIHTGCTNLLIDSFSFGILPLMCIIFDEEIPCVNSVRNTGLFEDFFRSSRVLHREDKVDFVSQRVGILFSTRRKGRNGRRDRLRGDARGSCGGIASTHGLERPQLSPHTASADAIHPLPSKAHC